MIKAKFACLLSVVLILAACTPPAPEPAEPAPTVTPTATVSSSCPNLTITATTSTPPSRDVTITASVEGAPADVAYLWNVSGGAISAGQGTSSVVVDPPVGEPLTATVQVNTTPEPCFGSATIEIP